MPPGDASIAPGIVAGIIAVGLIVVLVALRGLSGGKIEVRLSDAIIATIPIVLWLLISGRVTRLVVGTEGITVETTREAILKASSEAIKSQVPVVRVATREKGGFAEIPRLVRDSIEGLEFILGRQFYAGPAVQEYLTTLTEYPFFRYVIYKEVDGRLVGITDARKLTSFLRQNKAWNRFADQVNSGDRSFLANMPGFIATDLAVERETGKRKVLKRMEQLNVEWLPVVDGRRHFVGVVERSRLTASLILDVAEQLSSGP